MNRVWTGAALVLAVVVGVMVNVQHVGAMDQAVVIKNGGLCGMVGSDADGTMVFGDLGTQTTMVENANKVMLKCMGTGIRNASGVEQSWSGFTCNIIAPDGGSVLTEDSHATVSPDGVGTLTCSYRKPNTLS